MTRRLALLLGLLGCAHAPPATRSCWEQHDGDEADEACEPRLPERSTRPQTPAEHGSWMAKSKLGGWCAADSSCETDLNCVRSACVRPAP